MYVCTILPYTSKYLKYKHIHINRLQPIIHRLFRRHI